ncbi:hypothetical protein CVT24_012519 [Panaeolus cyanescens]|uniref:IRG-type G domain-containing protein n=1 Tax=Panaeolus cyanescens TaxID=181874 RepID=A0A409YLC5_9AGAR|nr:hypothetical protein CVT24_012519 [Panaeolus cyanescens]
MALFIPFLVSAAFVAAGVGVNALEKQSQREIEEAERKRIEAERIERENRERSERWAREAAWAQEQQRAALAREQAAVEEARREEARIQAALRAATEAKKREEDAMLALVRGIPPQRRPSLSDIRRIRRRFNYEYKRFNVAIVGESGMGKSTLLNSLRGLLSSDPGAARPGFNETTMSVKAYNDAYYNWFKWYDVPGANTPTITGWRYFTKQGLFIFDALIIVFCDRFTQTTGTLISHAETCGVPVFLVRTKADQLINNIQVDSDNEIDEAQARQICLKDTQSMVDINLQRMDLPPRMSYVVSRRAMREYVVKRDKREVLNEDVLIEDLESLCHKTLEER